MMLYLPALLVPCPMPPPKNMNASTRAGLCMQHGPAQPAPDAWAGGKRADSLEKGDGHPPSVCQNVWEHDDPSVAQHLWRPG